MKVLGLSCGRKMGNCEVLLREALAETEQLGAGTEIVRLGDLTIKPCKGCEGCVRNMFGGGEGLCVQSGDHMPFLLDKIADSDAVILSAPAYHLMPPGLLILVLNRILGAGKKYKEKIVQHPKVGAVITLGGTDWTNLVLPLTNHSLSRMLRNNIKIIDQMLVEYIPRPAQVLMHDDALDSARTLGRHVGEALNVPYSEVKYMGKEEETCPLCHNNLLKIRGQFVECPVCDIQGKIEVSEAGIRVIFEDEALQKSRFSGWGGKRHDEARLKGHEEFYERKAEIDEKLKKYKSQKGVSSPPPLR